MRYLDTKAKRYKVEAMLVELSLDFTECENMANQARDFEAIAKYIELKECIGKILEHLEEE